jgi:hypothetical protein
MSQVLNESYPELNAKPFAAATGLQNSARSGKIAKILAKLREISILPTAED